MNVSIIITFYSGIQILKLCIQNIIENTNLDGDLEVLIVNDNPNIDLTCIKEQYADQCDLSIHVMEKNSGYSAACNLGVKAAKYDYIVLMDCDIFPQKNWLKELLETFKRQPNPGAVSSKILEADSGKLFGYGIGIHGVDIIIYKRHGDLDSFSSVDRNFSMISSGCLLMKKRLYIEIGGQDENFFNADNDLDLTYRIYQSGKTNTMCAKSIVYHRGHVSGNIRTLPFRQDSKAWLFRKWGNMLSVNALDTISEILKSSNLPRTSKNMILVSFSNSLSRGDYFNTIANTLDIKFLQTYDIKNKDLLNDIFINDYLSWDICRTNIPIIYFTDDYRVLEKNVLWFTNRVCRDLIIDKNGNLIVKSNN